MSKIHMNDGELRAYFDDELPENERQAVHRHLDACSDCQGRLEALTSRAEQINRQFASLEPARRPIQPGAARARMSAYISRKENSTMLSRIFARRYRAAWAAAVIILVLGISLTFPPVQAIANSFLGLFRVQQITVVQVNPGPLAQQLGSSAQFQSMMSNDVKIEKSSDMQAASSQAEAAQLAGMPVRLPTAIQGSPKLEVTESGTASIKIDVTRVRALLQEIGRSDIQIPDGLNGSTITVQIPKGVTAQYGDCTFDPQKAAQQGRDPDNPSIPSLPNCTALVELPSPTVNAPEGLDVEKLGEAYLQVLGMSPAQAQQFAQTVDWSTTFVIPIPKNGTTFQQVTVDGVNGTLIRSDTEGQYLVTWVKDGIVYALSGPGSNAQALGIADSLK